MCEEKKRLSFTLSVPKCPETHVKRHSIHGITEEIDLIKPHQEIGHLSSTEKQYLLAVERGDVTTVHNFLMQNKADEILGKPLDQRALNINCVDPLGRSAIYMAIDNENFDMLKLLLDHKVNTKDALLYAISEEFVEAVELLLNYEESKREPGEPHVWERHPEDTTIFTPDITPLILAAHRDNFEIIKFLLDRGARIPVPHDNRCNCYECVTLMAEDSLMFSHSKLNAYRALSSPCLIALSSKDPILTAFELSCALRNLSKSEHEFKTDYEELKQKCKAFATDLLDHTRSSSELEILLNYDPKMDMKQSTKHMHLERLKLAIKLRQKEFVVHPNVQQLLASIWYEGLPGFRRRSFILQTLECLKTGFLFPIFAILYIFIPCDPVRKIVSTPFIKFICHSASYFLFLAIIILSSFGDVVGNFKISLMILISIYVFGYIWNEIKALWKEGYVEYISDMWNYMDFITTSLYLAVICIRIFLYHEQEEVKRSNPNNFTDIVSNRTGIRDDHPLLVSEALFAMSNVLSVLKLVYIFSINPYLGPLQIVLGRVIMDIAKFFFIYVLVLFAFSNGMHHLLASYAKNTEDSCKIINGTDMCTNKEYEKFKNLFNILQTLFWSAFGDLDLKRFNLTDITGFTKYWGMLMFGSYCVISIVVLLNLLIAMMNHSYEYIFERVDIEWKFARSKLWISHFEEGRTLPVPFNVIPTPKSFYYFLRWIFRKVHPKLDKDEFRSKSSHKRQMSLNERRYRNVMRNLVQRYLTRRQKRGGEHYGVTEDDINELKQEISTFRCDLYEILRNYGMKTNPVIDRKACAVSRKIRSKQRLFNSELSQSFSDSLDISDLELEKQVQMDKDDKKNLEMSFLADLLQPILHGSPISIFNKKKLKNVFWKGVSKGDNMDCDESLPSPQPEEEERGSRFEKMQAQVEISIDDADEEDEQEEEEEEEENEENLEKQTSIKFIDGE